MFRAMRRKSKELDVSDAKRILKDGEHLTLSTIGENGYPYSTPVNYAYGDDCIYFHSAKSGHKVDNIKNNTNVSFSVISTATVLPGEFDTTYESVIGFGNAYEVDSDEKVKGLIMLIEKYSPEFLEEGMKCISKAKDATNVIKIEIKHMTGKRN